MEAEWEGPFWAIPGDPSPLGHVRYTTVSEEAIERIRDNAPGTPIVQIMIKRDDNA